MKIPTDSQIRALAVAEFANDTNLQIDADAGISRSEEPGPAGETGAWVQAWVYVSYPKL
jgi:hypothetical protein